jgi:hypothetical protein
MKEIIRSLCDLVFGNIADLGNIKNSGEEIFCLYHNILYLRYILLFISWALVNTVINLKVPYKAEEFLE